MAEKVLYVFSAIAVGWAVTFLLRALPFLVFGSGGEKPRWLGRIDGFISPVIIGGLIVYSFSSLEWRTPWPYVALAATVAAYLAFRNSLAGIIAGTALYMALLSLAGCMVPVEAAPESSARNPPVRVGRSGIAFRGRHVVPDDVPRLLEKHGYSREKPLHILVDDDYDDKRALWVFKHNYIDRAGYTKSVWVHSQKGASGTVGILPKADGVKMPYQNTRSRGR
jgi:branched-subunit amino acid transport protein AzlD